MGVDKYFSVTSKEKAAGGRGYKRKGVWATYLPPAIVLLSLPGFQQETRTVILIHPSVCSPVLHQILYVSLDITRAFNIIHHSLTIGINI